MFALANKSQFIDHFNRLTHLTNLEYVVGIEALHHSTLVYFFLNYLSKKSPVSVPVSCPFQCCLVLLDKGAQMSENLKVFLYQMLPHYCKRHTNIPPSKESVIINLKLKICVYTHKPP